MKQQVGKFERIIEFGKAWDKRHEDPAKNYGIGACDVRFVLKGKEGAYQFVLYSGWYMTKNLNELRDKKAMFGPIPSDLGYHSRKPTYDGQQAMKDCPYLDGDDCFYDGSRLAAEGAYEIFVTEGEEALWELLEERYEQLFK